MAESNKYDRALQNILATMAGEDGGVGFCRLRSMIDALSRQAAVQNLEAIAVLEIVLKFSKLIDVAKSGKMI